MEKQHLLLFLCLCLSYLSFGEWTVLPSGTTNDLLAVDFIDAQNGVAVGSEGTILLTADGGSSWTPQSIAGVKEDFGSVKMYSPDTILVCSGTIFDGKLYRSFDGGQNWETNINVPAGIKI